jgi:hypothetical protein
MKYTPTECPKCGTRLANSPRGREQSKQSKAEQAAAGPPCEVCGNRPAVADGKCGPCAELYPKRPKHRRGEGSA